MSEPRTYAELRQQWLQRIVKGGDRLSADLADVAEVLRPAFLAAIEHLQHLLRDPERDRGEVVTALRPFAVARAVVKREDVPALIELARTAREVRGPGSQYIEQEALRTYDADSSMISAFGYDQTTGILDVAFHRTGVYRYYDVPLHVFEGLRDASSKGRYMRATIIARPGRNQTPVYVIARKRSDEAISNPRRRGLLRSLRSLAMTCPQHHSRTVAVDDAAEASHIGIGVLAPDLRRQANWCTIRAVSGTR
jgi:hypothetical protein